MATRFRTQFDENYKSSVFATDPGDEDSLTQQHMLEECDINNILKRYQASGQLSHINEMAGIYGDFSDVLDYKSGLDRIRAADEMFMELPAAIRDRFNNDPAKFVEFATNPDNLDAMREMGLAPAKPDSPAANAPSNSAVVSEGAGDGPKPVASPSPVASEKK